MHNIFRPNQLVELELNTADREGHREAYASRIEEVHPRYLLVAAPIRGGELVSIIPGDYITMHLFAHGALYSVPCRVQAHITEAGVPMLKVGQAGEITKIQKRSWVRLEVVLPVEYRMAGYPIDYYKGLTIDLSGGGLLMVTNHFIDLGTSLELRVMINDGFTLECLGQVTRCTKEEGVKSRYKIGIKFEELEEPTIQRIISFIFQKQRENIQKGSLKHQ